MLKTITISSMYGKIISVATSTNGKFMAFQYGDSNSQLQYWKWDPDTMVSCICVNTKIQRVTFLPNDEAAICVSGVQCCKMYRIGQDSIMKTVPIFPAKIDQHETFEDHCWANNYFIAITTQGKVFFIIIRYLYLV